MVELVNNIINSNNTAAKNLIYELADKGDAAACYHACWYEALTTDDPTKALHYLRKSAERNFYWGRLWLADMYLDGTLGLKQDTLEAYRQYEAITASIKRSQAYSRLGTIQRDHFKDYAKAKSMFAKAINDEDYEGYVGLASLYELGLGVEKDYAKAREYYKTAISSAKLTGFAYLLLPDEQAKPDIWKKVCEMDSLILLAQNGGVAPSQIPVSSSANYMQQLNQVINTSIDLEKRISLSEELLPKVFATKNCVVKTVGSNGTTIVSTEKAEDFLMRISTMSAKVTLQEVSSKKDDKGRLTELVVKEKKM